ncbi:MAG: type II toxin-antitoxin system RelE/ParE family toxin [Bacillota bacterium]
MEKYKLLIFPLAKQDLQEIVGELSQQAALKLYDDIIESIGSLEHMPLRYPLIKDPLLRAKGYRVMVVHRYLVFYIVKEKKVEIRRILYGKRQFEFLL